MKTNKQSPKDAKRSSFGANEKQPASMTKVGDVKRSLASKMMPKGHKMHKSGMSYIGK